MKHELDIAAALKLLELSSVPNLIGLKAAYRQAMKRWHPDVCKEPNAAEMTISIGRAYDLLQSAINVGATAADLEEWARYRQVKMSEWKSTFVQGWKKTLSKTMNDANPMTRGLHLNTFIVQFTRACMEPPAEWFYGALYKPTKANQAKYRNHLLAIAPNQLLREGWAMKYWKLEFQQPWTFYLPSAKDLPSDAAKQTPILAG